ncbi:type-F conjugative transfer system protein TrbI [Rouxiella badensis]|uniref:type-F conjugative transfer system protein TrbI n=1 Tax=Rouxiella badensis TaxID=1646377 RepID=UPI0017885315|nr:type-F conjugative transfer system protein TrbI [Rouxiella badensis]QOI58097.1 type-F conjugative transfer system protein TrbI [Rouxiella badensis subsp. acadiensis]
MGETKLKNNLWRQFVLPNWPLIISTLIIFSLITMFVSIAVVKSMTPEVVKFDMKGTVNSFMSQTAGIKTTLSKEQMDQMVSRFNQAMQGSIDDYANANNVIVVVSPAIVGGARDITDEIRNSIATKMKKGDE